MSGKYMETQLFENRLKAAAWERAENLVKPGPLNFERYIKDNMEDNILGCFVSATMGDDNGKLFRSYIFGSHGILENFHSLKYYNYGKDIKIILFQFYINPIPYLMQNIKEIEDYRKRESNRNSYHY